MRVSVPAERSLTFAGSATPWHFRRQDAKEMRQGEDGNAGVPMERPFCRLGECSSPARQSQWSQWQVARISASQDGEIISHAPMTKWRRSCEGGLASPGGNLGCPRKEQSTRRARSRGTCSPTLYRAKQDDAPIWRKRKTVSRGKANGFPMPPKAKRAASNLACRRKAGKV